jgi:hypothetical protein
MRIAALILGVVSLYGMLAAQHASRKIDFTRDVQPILSDNCYACHGPDESKRQAGVRLDTKDGTFAKGPNGPILVPGDAAASRLFVRVSHAKPAMRMPPAASGKTLTDVQIATLKLWIEQGAPWATHWSYSPAKRPQLPTVKKDTWVRNPIDRFILARLEAEGLAPQAEAPRSTLIRRLAFDLTGLPPAPADVEAFLADKRPDAYERLVDKYLASPQYGERMTMMWLDLARYADTHGYHIDSHRDMHNWREWVINSFNRNQRFDEFTQWQIAGDLLPKPNREQLLATGFHRNHMINFEGGAIPEEYQTEYVVDRVETTSNVWMGMTMGCARCHDHKYDPIKQKEFYEFFAFFNNIDEKGLDGRRGNAEPLLRLSTPEQEARYQKLVDDIDVYEALTHERTIAPNIEAWERTALATLGKPARDGLELHMEADNSFSDASGHYRHGIVERGEVTFAEGPVQRSAVFSGESQMQYAAAGDMGAVMASNKPWTAAFWFRSGTIQESGLLQMREPGDAKRGVEVLLEASQPIGDLRRGVKPALCVANKWPSDALYVRTRDFVWTTAKEAGSTWHHVGIVYDGSSKASGVTMFIDGVSVPVETRRDSLRSEVVSARPLEIGNKQLGSPYKGQLDDIRIYSRALPPAALAQLGEQEPVRAAFALTPGVPLGKRPREARLRIADYYLRHAAPSADREDYARLLAMRDERDALLKEIPTTMVMSERATPRPTFVLGRGDYRNKTVEVRPGTPSMLPQMPAELPRNRLGLAQWLTSRENPLTARVTVNRFWQMYFGSGIVKTAEDFGSQGDPPSHPELLDWLATEFMESGWDVKAMQKLIVTSAAYRQKSTAPRELIERDPENRLLAHGPRFRLPAEMLRDTALAASGLLNGKIGGESVHPYQPPGVWEEISYGDVYSAQQYEQDHGDALYRRSMYTFWKRTAPPTSMSAFDAPDREKCIARRARTNTPLQALVMMNDPQFIEAARALALRARHEAGSNADAARLRRAFFLATARQPSSKELSVLSALLKSQRSHYTAKPGEAAQLVAVGETPAPATLAKPELAAWTMVASAILNLDEVVTKE